MLFAGDVLETNFSIMSTFCWWKTTTAEGFIIQGKDVRGVKLCFQEESFEASRQAVLEIPNGPVNLVTFHMNHIFTHSVGHAGKSDAALALT